MELNNDLVAIHSHICGDGNMYKKTERRSPSSIRTGRTTKPFERRILEYTNTCSTLLDIMTTHLKNQSPETYVYRSDKKHRIQARNKQLYIAMQELEYQDGKRWLIPDEIIENTRFRRIWLRAFFDDEGTVSKDTILGYNTNKEAILTIREMLRLEGIDTTITERKPNNPKHRVCYTIRILKRSVRLFKNIGFNHPMKSKKYELILMNKNAPAGMCSQQECLPDFLEPR